MGQRSAMMMAASFEAGWFSVICCLFFVSLNNLVFRVRVPVGVIFEYVKEKKEARRE